MSQQKFEDDIFCVSKLFHVELYKHQIYLFSYSPYWYNRDVNMISKIQRFKVFIYRVVLGNKVKYMDKVWLKFR